MKNPKGLTWDDCIKLSQTPVELDEYLNAVLVQLTTEGGSVAIRAVEALRLMPIREMEEEFKNISSEDLYAARERARQWLNSEYGRRTNNGSASEA